MLRALDICSGIGGFHLGLAGIAEVVLACDIDKHARATYAANFPGTPLWGDLRTLAHVPDHDILCAGFPCQPFSSAAEGSGRKGFADTRGTLFFDIVRILRQAQPRMFILENVAGLVGHDGGRTLATILAELEAAGYAVQWDIINAKAWVPQKRRRIYLRGIRTDAADMLEAQFRLGASRVQEPPPPHPVLADIIHEFVDPEFAPPPMTDELKATLARRDEDNRLAGRGYRNVIVTPGEPANTMTSRYSTANRANENLILMPDPQYDITPAQELSIRTSFTKSGRDGTDILSALDEPCATLTTRAPTRAGRHAVVVGDGLRIRRLTPREGARVQGFPEWFILPKSDCQAYQQVGNAVVPAVVAAVARALVSLPV